MTTSFSYVPGRGPSALWYLQTPGGSSLLYRGCQVGLSDERKREGKGCVRGPVLDFGKCSSSSWSVSDADTQGRYAFPPSTSRPPAKEQQACGGWVNFLFVTEAAGMCTRVCAVWLEDGPLFIPWVFSLVSGGTLISNITRFSSRRHETEDFSTFFKAPGGGRICSPQICPAAPGMTLYKPMEVYVRVCACIDTNLSCPDGAVTDGMEADTFWFEYQSRHWLALCDHSLSMPQFPHLWNGTANNADLIMLLRRLGSCG